MKFKKFLSVFVVCLTAIGFFVPVSKAVCEETVYYPVCYRGEVYVDGNAMAMSPHGFLNKEVAEYFEKTWNTLDVKMREALVENSKVFELYDKFSEWFYGHHMYENMQDLKDDMIRDFEEACLELNLESA